jgi:hypothetical protein
MFQSSFRQQSQQPQPQLQPQPQQTSTSTSSTSTSTSPSPSKSNKKTNYTEHEQQQSQQPESESTTNNSNSPGPALTSYHAPPLKKQRATSTPVKHPKAFGAPNTAVKATASATKQTPSSTHKTSTSASVGSLSANAASSSASTSTFGLFGSPRFMQPTKASQFYLESSSRPGGVFAQSSSEEQPQQHPHPPFSPATSAAIEMEVNTAIQRRKQELKQLKERAAMGFQSTAGGTGTGSHGVGIRGAPIHTMAHRMNKNLNPQSRYAQYNFPIKKGPTPVGGGFVFGAQAPAPHNGHGQPQTQNQTQPQNQPQGSGRVRMGAGLGVAHGSAGTKAPSGLGVPARRPAAPSMMGGAARGTATAPPGGGAGAGPATTASVSFAAPAVSRTNPNGNGNTNNNNSNNNNHVSFQQPAAALAQTPPMQNHPGSSFPVEVSMSGAADHSNDTPVRPRQLDLNTTKKTVTMNATMAATAAMPNTAAAGHTPYAKAPNATAGSTPYVRAPSVSIQSPPMAHQGKSVQHEHDHAAIASPGRGRNHTMAAAVNHEASTPMTANRGRGRGEHAATVSPPDTVLKRANEALRSDRMPPLLPSNETLGSNGKGNGNNDNDHGAPSIHPHPSSTSSHTHTPHSSNDVVSGSGSKKEEMFRTMMDYATDVQRATADATTMQQNQQQGQGQAEAAAGMSTSSTTTTHKNKSSTTAASRPNSATLRRMAETAKLKKEALDAKRNLKAETEKKAAMSGPRGGNAQAQVVATLVDEDDDDEDEKNTQTTPRLFDDDDDEEEEEDDHENIGNGNENATHGMEGIAMMGGFGDLVSPVKPMRSKGKGGGSGTGTSAASSQHTENGTPTTNTNANNGASQPVPILEEQRPKTPEEARQFLPFVGSALQETGRTYSSKSNILYVGFASPYRLTTMANANNANDHDNSIELPLLFQHESQSEAEDTFGTRLSRGEQQQFMEALVRSTSPIAEQKKEAQLMLESFMCVQAHVLADKSVYVAGLLPLAAKSSGEGEGDGNGSSGSEGWTIQMQHYERESAASTSSPQQQSQPPPQEQEQLLKMRKIQNVQAHPAKSRYIQLGNVLYIDAFGMEQEYNLGRLYDECAHVKQMYLTSVLTTAWILESQRQSPPLPILGSPREENKDGQSHSQSSQQRPSGGGGGVAPMMMGRDREGADVASEQQSLKMNGRNQPPFSPMVGKQKKTMEQAEQQPQPQMADTTSTAPPNIQKQHTPPVPVMGQNDDEPPAMDTSSALILLMGMMLNGLSRLVMVMFVKLPYRVTKGALKLAFWSLIVALLWQLVRDDHGLHVMERIYQHNYATPANAQWPRIPLLQMLWDFLGIPGQHELGVDQYHHGIM